MKTGELIDSLCHHVSPVAGTRIGPRTLTAMWGFVSVMGVLVFVRLALGVRPDLGAPLFSIATFAALGLLGSAGYFAFSLAVPARNVSPWVRGLPMAFLSLFLFSLFFESIPSGETVADGMAIAGMNCSLCVLALALVPGLLSLLALRRLAPTALAATAGAWGLAMGAAGVLGICFHCPAHNAVHLLLYHAVPLVVIALVARYVGMRILRW